MRVLLVLMWKRRRTEGKRREGSRLMFGDCVLALSNSCVDIKFNRLFVMPSISLV